MIGPFPYFGLPIPSAGGKNPTFVAARTGRGGDDVSNLEKGSLKSKPRWTFFFCTSQGGACTS